MTGILSVGSSAVLGCWCILFVAWLVVFVLWLRALMAYNKTYRKYEQACREYEQSNCQPSDELILAQKSLGKFNEGNSVMLKFLCRLGLLVGYTDVNGHPSPNLPLAGRDRWWKLVKQTYKLQKVFGRSGNNKVVNFFVAIFRLPLNILHGKLWCNHKQPNVES